MEPLSAPSGGALCKFTEAGAQPMHHAFDDADAEDPFQAEQLQLSEMEPPEEQMQEHEEVSVQQEMQAASSQPAAAPQPTDDADRSWWHRVGEEVEVNSLRVGGATLHHSHCIAHFGTSQLRIVFCAHCGGTTQGALSPLLAEPCRHEASGTRQRQLNRMMCRAQWPSGALQCQYGRGELSPTISFRLASATTCTILRPGQLADAAVVGVTEERGVRKR